MAGLLQLFLNVDDAIFVKGQNDASPFLFGNFVQGENVPIDLQLLRRRSPANLLNPFSVVTDSVSCKVGLVTPGVNSSTIHAQVTLTFDGARNVHSGSLNLATAAIATLLGTSTAIATTLEVEITSADGVRTIQRAVNVAASGLKTASTVPIPADQYYTKAQANAAFVTFRIPAGVQLQFTTPTTGKIVFVYVGDDEQLHVETRSP